MASFGRWMLEHWALDPSIVYLNHGTVGAPPRKVLAAQQAIRDAIERQPSRFLLRELAGLRGVAGGAQPGALKLQAAADAVAAFLGARGEDLVFVDNATTGTNAVLRSLPLERDDEILITDQAYGAVANVAAFVARERGALVRTVTVPYPVFDPGALVEEFERAVSPRTRVAVFDHIVSATGIVLPVAEIAARCRARDVRVLVDGAHAPGQIALDLPSLGVDWYTANLHKWAHAPRSCGVLWAAPDRQAGLHPPVVSWGLDQGFHSEFDWVGTRDPSPWLAAPEGIAFLKELGVAAVRAYNHGLAWDAARLLGDRWGTTFGVPEAHVPSMVTVPAPERFGATRDDATRLRDALLFEDEIEVHAHAAYGRVWIRVSAQVYNDRSDVERLAEAVAARR
jgi:isopenicillin-N epimerase